MKAGSHTALDICKCLFYKQAILREFDHFGLVITKEIVNPCGGVQIQTALLAGILYSISVFTKPLICSLQADTYKIPALHTGHHVSAWEMSAGLFKL